MTLSHNYKHFNQLHFKKKYHFLRVPIKNKEFNFQHTISVISKLITLHQNYKSNEQNLLPSPFLDVYFFIRI